MTTPNATDKGRRAELAKAHIARKTLGLDEENWRAIVRRVSADFRGAARAVESSGEMNAAERRALLNELTRLGFQPSQPRDKADDWIETKIPHLKKLLACWFELMRIGAVQTPSAKRSLRKFSKKMTGVDTIEWLTASQANVVIEACKGWRDKFEAQHPATAVPLPAAEKQISAPHTAKAAAYEILRRVSETADPLRASAGS